MIRIGEIIKELRKENNETQQQLSEALKINKYIISNWEQGRSEPSTEDLVKIATHFEITTDYLLGREDELGHIVAVESRLSKKEREIVELYNKLDGYQQQDILVQLKALVNRKG